MELASETPTKGSNNLKQGDIPDRQQVSKSQYYLSVRNQPRNTQNILQQGTPDGQSANRQDPKGFSIDGSIDPSYIRNQTNPNSAPPYNYFEGAEGRNYSLPASTYTSSNSIGLIQQARQSYYNRMNLFEPRSKNTIPDPSISKTNTQPIQAEMIGQNTNNMSIKNDRMYA